MAVLLRVEADGRIVADAYLISEDHGVRGPIAFIVDTGSQRTILGPRDAETIRFPVRQFPPYRGPPLVGIGGKGRPFDAGACQIVLGDAEIVATEQLLYFKPERETRFRTRRGGGRRERRERVYIIPSLLGTDVFRRNRLVLEADFGALRGVIRKSR